MDTGCQVERRNWHSAPNGTAQKKAPQETKNPNCFILFSKTSFMSKSEEKRRDDLVKEEEACTDLLFGDVKEADTMEVNRTVDEDEKELPALWHDSDDEEVRVELKRVARNRKFRKEETESEITGGELSKRLRTQ